MKIVCGSCQAKYSIADEKVAGKVFKIRCKRCSEVIVVRGDQEEPAANQSSHEEPAADAIWHVVLNGEQAGPYAPAQLADMINAGSLDWEAYVWTEGFENWLPMRDVPELVTAISGPPESEPQQQAQPEPVRAAVGAPVYSAAQPSMGADPFADEGATTAGVFASSAMAQPAPAARPNLFVARDESPFEAENRVVASAPSPRVTMEQAMTGARNENSVLFSLKNLQALATGSSAPGAPAGPSQRPGFAGGEGSGLIDIRALASATGVNDQGRQSEKDALLSLGSAQAGAFGALGSPMLAPPARDEDSGKKGLVFAIIGGFALLAVAGVGAALILKPAPSAPTVVAPVAPPPVAAVPPPQAAAPQPAEPPSEGEIQAQKRAQQQQHEAAAAPAAPSGEAHRPAAAPKRGEKSASDVAAKPEPVAAKPEPAPKPKGGSSSIDDLLDSAIGGAKGPGAKSAAAAPAASTANLPDKPSRDDVLNAMNGIKGPVAACANGQSGVAFANITVSGKTGKVSNVEVTGMTGEVGSCIARTVRKANFPKFKSDSFQIKFPFRL
jgi:predicted Zn finger-like uncharacterized protein